MAAKLARRIKALEQQAAGAPSLLGCRYFTHLAGVHEPGQYVEGDCPTQVQDARVWSEADLAELRAAGWFIIQLNR